MSILPQPGAAYPTYHGPSAFFPYCSATACHPGFIKRGPLHDLHVAGSDPMTGECTFCHRNSGDLPIIMYSGDGLGCMGCHGRDYGQTIEDDYEGETIAGLPKNSGVGLRAHHAEAGVAVCASCHTDDPDPYPENVIDPGLGNTVHYYLRVDNKGDPLASLGGNPIDPSSNEDTANDADSTGLDNDGDNLYDMADPDSILNPSEVFISKLESGGLLLTWPTPSPGWILKSSTTMVDDWGDLPTPDFRDRQNGFWQVTVDPPLDPKQFYRASDTPAAAAASVKTLSKSGNIKSPRR